MKIKHTVTLTIEEVFDFVKNIFAKKGYSGEFTIDNLKTLCEEKTIDIYLDRIGESDEKILLNSDHIIFPDILIKRLVSRACHLSVFFFHLEKENLQVILNEAFQRIKSEQKEILNFLYELDKDIHSRTVQKLKDVPGNLKDTELRAIYRDFSKEVFILLKKKTIPLKLKYSREDILNFSIRKVGFSARTENCLRAYEIEFVSNLLEISDEKLIRLHNFGNVSFEEIRFFKELYNF